MKSAPKYEARRARLALILVCLFMVFGIGALWALGAERYEMALVFTALAGISMFVGWEVEGGR